MVFLQSNRDAYQTIRLLEQGVLKPDKSQFLAVNKLQAFYNQLKNNGFKNNKKGNDTDVTLQQGFYLHGEVGTGKTLLMDLFYDTIPDHVPKKRVHFNMFMLYMYSELNRWNLCSTHEDVNFTTPTKHVADSIIKDTWLLCFDEVQLADYASSSLISGVFQHMIDSGAVIVATSNRAPNELGDASISETKDLLYEIRDELPDVKTTFSQLFQKHCEVFNISSDRDHRTEMTTGAQRYLYPNNPETENQFDLLFVGLVPEGGKIQPAILEVYSRRIHVPLSADNVARFSFSDLCRKPLGPADYLKICSTYGHVFVDDIPHMTLYDKNEARRFLTFIDAAYECRTQVYFKAVASIDDLFKMVPDEDQKQSDQMQVDMMQELAFDLKITNLHMHALDFLTGQDEIFSYRRAVSRIKEMQSAVYQQSAHRKHAFFPYTGTAEERHSAAVNRKRRDEERKKMIAAKEQLAGKNFSDEASYASISQQLASKEYNERQKDSPKFSDAHFWGMGWWEKIMDHVKKPPKK